ncbi:hypothetical protein [Cohnella sp.]|uniref:hypothetical protein n=1 Tax=Cohnella sp. TaxID=1883426 RepID=UPI0037043DA3
MMKKTWIYIGLSLILAVTLSACQSSNNSPKSSNTEAAQSGSPESANAKMPEYLPADFPLPKDAKINTSHSQLTEGKKSALLIFTTEESMATVTEMYTEYFKKQSLGDSVQTIDDKNIIIQGDNLDKKESWSLIGGALASLEGVVELTVTWSEL